MLFSLLKGKIFCLAWIWTACGSTTPTTVEGERKSEYSSIFLFQMNGDLLSGSFLPVNGRQMCKTRSSRAEEPMFVLIYAGYPLKIDPRWGFSFQGFVNFLVKIESFLKKYIDYCKFSVEIRGIREI